MRDTKLVFSDAQSVIINSGANSDSTNRIDLTSGNGKDALGNARVTDPSAGGRPVVEIVVTTALVGSGATLTVRLYEHDTDETIVNGNLIASIPIVIGAGGIALGTRYSVPIPADVITERYIGLNYAAAGANVTAGAVDAAIVNGREKYIP